MLVNFHQVGSHVLQVSFIPAVLADITIAAGGFAAVDGAPEHASSDYGSAECAAEWFEFWQEVVVKAAESNWIRYFRQMIFGK